MIGALCFGLAFGAPFVIWGAIIIVDRDRSWQRKIQRVRESVPPRRTRAWDRRQILYGSLLIAFGSILIALLFFANFSLGGISPPAPF